MDKDEPRFISPGASAPIRTFSFFILSIAILGNVECASSRKISSLASPPPSVNASSVPSNSPAARNQDLQALCNRVSEIKTLPYYPEEADDPAFLELYNAGEKVIPCLIDKVGDTTSMRDPRMDPGYAGIDNKVGDVALWVLEDIIHDDHFDVVQFLPPKVQADFKEDGVYAYFKYVQKNEHRMELQNKLYKWYREKYGKEASPRNNGALISSSTASK